GSVHAAPLLQQIRPCRQRGDPSLGGAVGSRTRGQQHRGSQGTDVGDLFGQLFLGASVDGEVEAYAKELSLTPGKGSSHLAGVLSRYLGLEIFQFALLSGDRKSTRLNSSHVSISYAVFCLKKKIKTIDV